MTDQDRRPTIQEIKDRYPLQEVLPRYMPGALRLSGDHLVGCCPFHDDRSPSWAAYLSTQTWQCFAASCELGGDVIDFVGYARFGRAWNSRDQGMFKEALDLLTGGGLPPLRETIPTDWRRREAWRLAELEPRAQMILHTAASLYHTALLAQGRGASTPYAYLRDERGFTDETIRREGLGYAEGGLLMGALLTSGFSLAEAGALHLLNPLQPDREFMAGRLVFVERDRSGRVLHLIGRRYADWLHPEAPKYLSLKEMDKPLYGYAQLDKRPSNQPVILVESPPDALTARQWGWAALANIGTKMKFDHAARLAVLRRPLAIAPHNDLPQPDGSFPGWAAAERWKADIGQGKIVPLPDGVKDLNELGQQADGAVHFERLLKQFGFERGTPPPAGNPRRAAQIQRDIQQSLTLWESLSNITV